MSYQNILKAFLIGCFSLSFVFSFSFGLTESVDLFGEINSVDLILNDIWMEPENPINGEAVTIHGSVYNAGVIPSGEVSDAVTVGFIVNGELVEIELLPNILPGIENGIEISTGPVFDAISGEYIVTGIVNYHDTLSHLRDNPGNNIVQKKFQIGDDTPLIINFDVSQNYNQKTKTQKIIIQGEVTDIFQKRLGNQEVIIGIGKTIQEKIITDTDGQFLFKTDIPFKNESVKISAYLEESPFVSSLPQKIFPVKIYKDQSALALEIIPYLSKNSLQNSPLTIVVFQDSYENLFKKISTNDPNNQILITENYFITVLPADHEYIVEVYIEGRLLDAFQRDFPANGVIKKEISISESAQVKFRIVNETGEPQSDVIVDNWIYSTTSDENGFTEWIELLPTFYAKEPYVAKAIFPDKEVIWSEPFIIEPEEKKVISIIKGSPNP